MLQFIEGEDWVRLERDKAIITLLYASGMRISEALSITKHHMKGRYFANKG
jgi:site-specific recombinase XerD